MCRFHIKHFFFLKQQEALISSRSLAKVLMGAGHRPINTLRSQAGCSLYGWPRVLGWALLAIFPYFSIG